LSFTLDILPPDFKVHMLTKLGLYMKFNRYARFSRVVEWHKQTLSGITTMLMTLTIIVKCQ